MCSFKVQCLLYNQLLLKTVEVYGMRSFRVCEDLNALVSVCLHQVCLIINGIQSLHLLTNTRTPAKQHSLFLSFSLSLSVFFLSVSLFQQSIDQQLPLQVCKESIFLWFPRFEAKCTPLMSSTVVKAQVVVCFASLF